MDGTMNTKSFKEFLASSGPDRPRTPAKSRALRQAEVAPRVAAEVLEARRLLSASVIGNVLVVTGTSSAEHIEVYSQPADNNNIYVDINFVSPTFGPFNPANITKTQINGLAGNDTVLAYPGSLPHSDSRSPLKSTAATATTRSSLAPTTTTPPTAA